MKYFEKTGYIKELAKAIKGGGLDKAVAIKKRDQLIIAKNALHSAYLKNPDEFLRKGLDSKKSLMSNDIVTSSQLINKMASTTSPVQGTPLLIQTRGSQRKYKSKILGKKNKEVLVPLWN